MNADVTQTAMNLAAGDHLVGLVPLILGFLIVIALIWAVWLGIRLRNREPEPPDKSD